MENSKRGVPKFFCIGFCDLIQKLPKILINDSTNPEKYNLNIILKKIYTLCISKSLKIIKIIWYPVTQTTTDAHAKCFIK